MAKLMQSLFRAPKRLVERTFGIRILKMLPRGLDFLFDMRKSLPWPSEPTVIVDVGANTGQSAIPLSRTFPDATVHCFEPSNGIFESLARNTRSHTNIICHHLGLSDSEGGASLALTSDPTMNHLTLAPGEYDCIESVSVTTLDRFCEAHRLSHIDILKIDTEGHDLSVLLGANELLAAQRIEVVYCEASMNLANRFHAPAEKIIDLMQHHGYYIFAIYEQVSEWTLRKSYLRRANIAFLSPKLADRSI